MARIFTFFLTLFTLSNTSAQQDAWIYFSDKPMADYYLSNPLEMLTQNALDRRSAHGIVLDVTDVPLDAGYVQQVAAAPGITVMARSKWLNVVHVRGSIADIQALSSLNFVSSVVFADASLNASGRQVQPQSGPVRSGSQSLANYDYGISGPQVEMIGMDALHLQDYTGNGIRIAVVDTGFPGVDTAAPFQSLNIAGGYDFVNDNPDFYNGANHGTRVLSALGGFASGQLVGTAPDATYYLFASEDVLSENPVEETYWAEAAEAADSLGVSIISTSLGYSNFDNPAYNYTYEDMDGATAFITRAAEVAFTRGIIVVAAAGNSGGSSLPHIMAPSDGEHVLCIGAVNASEQYATFSSIGPSADNRVKPDVVALGAGTIVANMDGSISALNGTSFATPVISGAIACLWQAAPELSNQEIIDLVRQSADQYSNPDAFKGYGVPDFNWALNQALSVHDFSSDGFRVYPNPVASQLHFSASVTGQIRIYDISGQLLISADTTNDNIDVSRLATGLYGYVFESADQVKRGKFLKK